jgi:hypothetical protein
VDDFVAAVNSYYTDNAKTGNIMFQARLLHDVAPSPVTPLLCLAHLLSWVSFVSPHICVPGVRRWAATFSVRAASSASSRHSPIP